MAVLTKEQLADPSRYNFAEAEVDLHEIGGSIKLKALSLEERLALPSMLDGDGEYKPTLAKLAASFAAMVSQPKLTVKEAEGFLGKLPTTAYDRIQAKFAEMLGTEEERRATVKEFPSTDN